MDQVHRTSVHVLGVVGVIQRLQHLAGDERGQRQRQAHTLLRAGAQQRQRVKSVDEFQRDEVLAAHLAEIEDLHDLRMRQLRRQLGLVDEHRHEGLVRSEVGQDPLDDDDLLEAVRRDDLRAEDLGHATDGQPLQQRVAAELRGQ